MNTNQLQQQGMCTICRDRFRTPTQLPCRHKFCLQCLQTLLNSAGGQHFNCPLCRREYQNPANGIAGFNIAMNQHNVPQLRTSSLPFMVTNRVSPDFRTPNHGRTEDDEVVIDRTIPFVENQMEIERGILDQQPWQIQISNDPDNTRRPPSQSVRQVNRNYLEEWLRNGTQVKVGIAVLVILTFTRIVAGAVKLGSDCHDEKDIALYSLVKGCFGFFFYLLLPYSYRKMNMERALSYICIKIIAIIYALFTVSWFCYGTALLLVNYTEMKTECPKVLERVILLSLVVAFGTVYHKM